MNAFWQNAVWNPLKELGQQVVAGLPGLLALILLLVIGLILGWLAKEVVYRVLRLLHFDRLCDRLGFSSTVRRLGLSRSGSYFVGQVLQGVVILGALLAGLNAVKSNLTRSLVERFFLYLPHLLAAIVVLLAGTLISRFVARSVLIAAANAQWPAARWWAGLTRAFVMILTIVAALDELGISRLTLIVTFAILFGGVVTAAAIAFGLGARDLARDFLESRFHPSEGASRSETLRHV